jgi:heme exporter protein D
MDLGPHAAFIWASYGAFIIVLAALIGWLLADGKRQTDALAALEARGVKRRSQQASGASNNGIS